MKSFCINNLDFTDSTLFRLSLVSESKDSGSIIKDGVEISKEKPIYLDLPYPENRETYVNKANAMKQSVEKALDGKVIVSLVPCTNDDEWYYAGYYTSYGYEANFDIFDLSGWGPDYGDPQTFLDTMLPDYAGYCVKSLGIF